MLFFSRLLLKITEHREIPWCSNAIRLELEAEIQKAAENLPF